MKERDVLNLIKNDAEMMNIISIAASLNLPQWIIGAGFVRNKVWDHLHGYRIKTVLNDIDLVYFDTNETFDDQKIELELVTRYPDLKWEVVNQATVHDIHGDKPYVSISDSISKWPETATAVGVKIKKDELELIAPFGIEDLVNMIVRPTPAFMVSESRRNIVLDRLHKKRWLEKWPKIKLHRGLKTCAV